MNNYSVYAIKSLRDQRIYVGISRDATKRLKEHNDKHVFSTKGFAPWKIIYCALIGERKNARIEEKRLKSGAGKEFLKSL